MLSQSSLVFILKTNSPLLASMVITSTPVVEDGGVTVPAVTVKVKVSPFTV